MSFSSYKLRILATMLTVLANSPTVWAIAWNGTDPNYSAVNTNSNGLSDGYGEFSNVVLIGNRTENTGASCNYLGNGWFLTARHVAENAGNFNQTAPNGQIEIFVGQYYYSDGYVSNFPDAASYPDITLVHVANWTTGPLASLSGIEKRQVGGFGDGLAQLGGYGGYGFIGSSSVGVFAFHRAFTTPVYAPNLDPQSLFVNTNANTRLKNDGYLMGVQRGGDSGSAMWENAGYSDQDLDLYDYSLTGICSNGGGLGFGSEGGGYMFIQKCGLGTILNTVYAHSTLSWNARAAFTATATDGSGTWNDSNTNWTDGTNWAFNSAPITGPQGDTTLQRTEQAIFGVGNGAAGTVTLGSTVNVSDIIFNAAGSGTYTIAGAAGLSLHMRASSQITTNVNATIGADITGGGAEGLQGFSGWTVAKLSKFGGGTLTLTGHTTLDPDAAFYARAGTTALARNGSFRPGFYTSVAVYDGESATLTVQENATYDAGGLVRRYWIRARDQLRNRPWHFDQRWRCERLGHAYPDHRTRHGTSL
jgi:hypothetical protein